MEKKNKIYITIVWLISLLISIGLGTHALHFLENIGLNIWIARFIGCGVCAGVGILFYYLWIKKVLSKLNS